MLILVTNMATRLPSIRPLVRIIILLTNEKNNSLTMELQEVLGVVEVEIAALRLIL